MQILEVRNPATDEIIGQYPLDSAEVVGGKLALAEQAFQRWRREPLKYRIAALSRLSALLTERLEQAARQITLEMGKPIAQAEAEVSKCAACCDFFADRGEELLRPEIVTTEASYSAVHFEPLGVVLAVMPWNFPFWQVIRCAVPALLSGNTVVLKHASNVTGCAELIQELVREAEFPEGVFQHLKLPSSGVESVIRSPVVQAVSLTGSEPAGRAVAGVAGAELKKVVLELGGSDPFLVMEDAPIEEVVRQALTARLQSGGQSCIAAKRFIVARPVGEQFLEQLDEALSAVRVGDPLNRENQVGPLARNDIREENERLIGATVASGATLHQGGERLPSPGYYLRPALLSGVLPGMALFDEESFGPVFSICFADNTNEMLQLAARSRFGLGASIWTSDPERAKKLVTEIDSGMVFINSIVRSDMRLPFGGVKCSGFGRELSQYGLREFVNLKTVYIR